MKLLIYLCLSLSIVGLAFYLRFDALDTFPLQADEATGAYFVGQALEHTYQYNPNHFHGPTLIYFAQLSAWLSDQHTWVELSQQTLRNVNLSAGILLIVLVLAMYKSLGKKGSLISASLLTVSPFITYYNRIFIHESLLSLFLFLGLCFLYHFLKKPDFLKAILIGVCLGLAASTKETFVITLFAWLLSILLLAKKHFPFVKQNLLQLIALCCTSLLVIFLFYTNLCNEIDRFLDFFKAFWSYETTEGHDKPFYYYVNLFALPTTYGRLFWWEGAILCIAFCSFFVKSKKSEIRHFLLLSGGVQLIFYSLLSYKVPWLLLVPWSHFVLVAALTLGDLINKSKQHAYFGIVFSCILLIVHVYQSNKIIHRYHSDHRNPFAYVPTSKSIVPWSSKLLALSTLSTFKGTSYVVGNDYWPLPWYLKSVLSVEYVPMPSERLVNAPLVIAMPNMSNELKLSLAATHQYSFQGLRHEVPMTVFIRNDVWKQAYE